jgi:hypothetical protein
MVGFKYNNFVRLQGLRNAAYNGKIARITTISAEENDGTVGVELQENEVAPTLSRKILAKPENMLRACDCCHLAGAATMQYCGRCKNAAYCNAECQRSDWKSHKVDCSRMNTERQLFKSPLHFAAGVGNLAEVQNLVRGGADVNKTTKEDGFTPVCVAVQLGHLAVVQYLVQQGADVNKIDNNGCTPLFYAAQYGHLAIAQYLVQQGAEKDKAKDDGITPLFVAAHKGDLAVVQYLVQQGADINQAMNGGFTPLCVAAHKGHTAVANYLREQGAI